MSVLFCTLDEASSVKLNEGVLASVGRCKADSLQLILHVVLTLKFLMQINCMRKKRLP